jgi:hypothetical protein
MAAGGNLKEGEVLATTYSQVEKLTDKIWKNTKNLSVE